MDTFSNGIALPIWVGKVIQRKRIKILGRVDTGLGGGTCMPCRSWWWPTAPLILMFPKCWEKLYPTPNWCLARGDKKQNSHHRLYTMSEGFSPLSLSFINCQEQKALQRLLKWEAEAHCSNGSINTVSPSQEWPQWWANLQRKIQFGKESNWIIESR